MGICNRCYNFMSTEVLGSSILGSRGLNIMLLPFFPCNFHLPCLEWKLLVVVLGNSSWGFQPSDSVEGT